MTDFIQRVLRPERPDWIIRSLLDVDFYKFTMGYFIHRFFPEVQVTFRFINRHPHIPVAELVDEDELRAQLDHVRTLRFRRTDIYYLRGMDVYGEAMFSREYLDFLAGLKLPPYTLDRRGDQYEIQFTGTWAEVTFWETIAMAIVNELVYRTLLQGMAEDRSTGESGLQILYARATDKLYHKLQRLAENPSIHFADFGKRRRHSFLWQQFAIEMAEEVVGQGLTGVSNTWMAFNKDLVPIGTNAHELPMVLTALADTNNAKRDAQYMVLEAWGNLFPQNALRIMLPDTYGTEQFFSGMSEDMAHEVSHAWRGLRGDSGDLVVEGERYIKWLTQHGVDPKEKLYIPSDGLDVEGILKLNQALGGRVQLAYGWGTKFTNDFESCHPHGNEPAVVNGKKLHLTWDQLLRGHSFVCKVASADDKPAVKLSNNVNKATGPVAEIDRYLRVFGEKGRLQQRVEV